MNDLCKSIKNWHFFVLQPNQNHINYDRIMTAEQTQFISVFALLEFYLILGCCFICLLLSVRLRNGHSLWHKSTWMRLTAATMLISSAADLFILYFPIVQCPIIIYCVCVKRKIPSHPMHEAQFRNSLSWVLDAPTMWCVNDYCVCMCCYFCVHSTVSVANTIYFPRHVRGEFRPNEGKKPDVCSVPSVQTKFCLIPVICCVMFCVGFAFIYILSA